MILSISQNNDNYSSYTDLNGKINRDVRNGKLFKVCRGVYIDDRSINPYFLAPLIYSPSYVSFDTALSDYGLIPESTLNNITLATCGKKKSKAYHNIFGNFYYQDVPTRAFSSGLILFSQGDYSFYMASKEKALCDKLYSLPPVKSQKELKHVLFESLRIDPYLFSELDKDALKSLIPLYRCTNLNYLMKII